MDAIFGDEAGGSATPQARESPDEELIQVLRTPQVHLVTAIGLAGLGALLYLMVFKPL